MSKVPNGVRPTRRCLADLNVQLLDLGTPLEEIDHPVLAVAQTLPERRNAGGAQRILALGDRVWFKVKTGNQRAVVTELTDEERPTEWPSGIGAWWIGAAGRRQADSPQRDFYESIERGCTAGKTVSTSRLLPVEVGLEAVDGRASGRLAARVEAAGCPIDRHVADNRPGRGG